MTSFPLFNSLAIHFSYTADELLVRYTKDVEDTKVATCLKDLNIKGFAQNESLC